MPASLSPSGEPVIMAPARGSRISAVDGGFFNCELMSLYGHPSSGYALAIGMSDRLLNRNLRDGGGSTFTPNVTTFPRRGRTQPAQCNPLSTTHLTRLNTTKQHTHTATRDDATTHQRNLRYD